MPFEAHNPTTTEDPGVSEPSVPLSLKSLELILQCGVDVICSDIADTADDTVNTDNAVINTFQDPTISPAMRLFIWDLLSIMIYHSPQGARTKERSRASEEKLLTDMQRFFANNPAGYQHSLSRMSKRLHSEPAEMKAHETTETASKTDFDLNDLGLQMAHRALLSLQSKTKRAAKKNHCLFKVTPAPINLSSLISPSWNQTESDAFIAWLDKVEEIAPKINLLDLPATILNKLTTITSSAQETAKDNAQSTLGHH